MVGKMDADAGMVRAYGDGLSQGQTGQLCKFIVNTTNAGSGALAVTIDGPSKVQLNCKEVAEGYEFTYTPMAPGDYMITIKYAGIAHVPGSPFKARITGQGKAAPWSEQSQVVVETVTKTSTTQKYASFPPEVASDASKVRTSGVGLQRAVLNSESMFNVDATGAGHNMLMVGILGPTIPCEEIRVRHVGGCQYTCSYICKERGDYVLVVKWGDQHVPGSPYRFQVQ
ncbi:hypothetical protein CAPTEDRAFT_151296 [Capitella teleta]|uniref:Uncharacterized protein n=1 Tax=Capitella teleta TaxID=283909 RepID=R7U949_CAPTE|nr:hypothetical protein CAPTEDRAFT_151296 [Capitella teleta]|eukprot:ELU02479.1 hypothetical protein CAPTEDRAFT_151296 [Capitella teleta]